jgi:hypothetical protein
MLVVFLKVMLEVSFDSMNWEGGVLQYRTEGVYCERIFNFESVMPEHVNYR